MGRSPLWRLPFEWSLSWEQFRTTPAAQEGIAKFGEASVLEAFKAIAFIDGRDAITDNDLARAAEGGQHSPVLGFVVEATKEQLKNIGFRLRTAPELSQKRPGSVTRAEKELFKELGANGIFKRVEVTGYRSQRGAGAVLTEIQVFDASAAEYEAFSSPKSACIQVVAKSLGLDVADIATSYDAEREVIVFATGFADEPEVLNKPSPADFITHHNQSLDAWNEAKSRGLIGDGNTLIHVDSHSDMCPRPGSSESIADYINRAMIDGTVADVYWVLPDGLPPKRGKTQNHKSIPRRGGVPYSFPVWVCKGSHLRFERPENFDSREYSRVEVHVVRLSDLEPEAMEDTHNILLDIDLDYFSNVGHDTHESWSANPATKKLHQDLDAFASKFSNLSPALTTVCLSPEYTNEDDQQPLLDFFRQWFPHDFIANVAGAYAHKNTTDTDRFLFRFVEQNVIGENNRNFEEALFTALTRRGFEDLAASYKSFCEGTLSKKGLDAAVGVARWLHLKQVD